MGKIYHTLYKPIDYKTILLPFKDETYSECVKIVSYFRRSSKSRPLSLSFEEETKVFGKLNDFTPHLKHAWL